jgi:hypothetical protein
MVALQKIEVVKRSERLSPAPPANGRVPLGTPK